MSLNASALIERSLEASGHALVMAAMPDGPRRLANIDAFLSQLHTWAQGGQADVSGAARAIKRAVTLDLPVPEALLGTEDAVQVMTIHGSKGLEFPAVIVPDLLAGGRADNAPLLMDAEAGLALRVPDIKPADQPALHQKLQGLAAERRSAEDERIMYVALTRAADLLILTATAKASEAMETDRLSSQLPEQDVVRYAYAVNEIPQPEAGRHRQTGVISVSGMSQALALPESLPVTSIGVYLGCPRAFQYRYVTGRAPFTPLWRPEVVAAEGGTSGAAIGSAVHQAIERGWTGAEILSSFPQLSFTDRREVAALTGALERDEYAALRGLKAQREIPISHSLYGLTFEGVVDANYVDAPGGNWTVDYKTDRRAEPHEHAPQLALYQDATGSTRASLAYLRHDLLYTLTEDELRRGREQIQSVARGVQAFEFDPAPSEAACRLCIYRMVCDAAT